MPGIVFHQRTIRENWYHVVLRREGLPDEGVDLMIRGVFDRGPTVYVLACLAVDLVGENGESHYHPEGWMIDGGGRGAGGVATDDVMSSVRVGAGQRLLIKFVRCVAEPAEIEQTGRGGN